MFTPSYFKSSLQWDICPLTTHSLGSMRGQGVSPSYRPSHTFARGTTGLSEQTHAGNGVPMRFMIEMSQFMAVPGMIREVGGEGSDLN